MHTRAPLLILPLLFVSLLAAGTATPAHAQPSAEEIFAQSLKAIKAVDSYQVSFLKTLSVAKYEPR